MVVEGRSRILLGTERRRVGTISVTVAIGDPERRISREIEAEVDTAATFSQIPGRILRELGHVPIGRSRFQTADGRRVEREVGEVPLRFNGEVRITTCVFADDDGPVLLGAVTLEQFLLAVDPVNDSSQWKDCS